MVAKTGDTIRGPTLPDAVEASMEFRWIAVLALWTLLSGPILTQPSPQPAQRSAPGGAAIAALVGAAVLLVFMLQNRDEVKVHLLFWRARLPLWFVIFGSALLGAVVWVGIGLVRRRRHRVASRRSRSRK